MNNKDVKKVVEYWKITAQRDYDTMLRHCSEITYTPRTHIHIIFA